MPDVWGMLPKSQIDNEKIEEAINRLLASHNDDESAHLGAGQSLQSHKASEIIDHAVKSILAEKLHTSAQVAECVVAPEGGDYPSIENALADGKKRIYVKAGTYIVESPGITITDDNVEIYGEDKDQVILKAKGGNNQSFNVFRFPVPVASIVIKGLTIDANKVEQTGENAAVGCISFSTIATDVLITDCIIKNSLGVGAVRFSSSNAKNIKIINNLFLGTSSYFGVSASFGESLVSDNTFQSCYGAIQSLGNDNIIANNLIKSNTFGIYLQGDRNLVIGNLCKSNSRIGITIQSGKHQLVVGNKCYSNGIEYGEAGINIASSVTDSLVVGNISISNFGPGILVYLGYRCTVSGNVCALNRQEGIRLSGSQYIAITGNSLYKNSQESANTYAAILLGAVSTYYSCYNSVSGNTIDATSSPYGIREGNVNCNKNEVIGNVVRNAATAQISLQGANSEAVHNIIT